MTEYHHLINHQTYGYSNTAVYGRNEYDKSGHFSIFAFMKHLMMLFNCKFFRASFLHHINDTYNMYGLKAQILKVGTLLTNAFN